MRSDVVKPPKGICRILMLEDHLNLIPGGQQLPNLAREVLGGLSLVEKLKDPAPALSQVSSNTWLAVGLSVRVQ